MKKIFFAIGLWCFVPWPIEAAGNDITITCPAGGPDCTMVPNPGDPLFYETNMLPGDTITKTLTVINQDQTQACNLEVKAYNDRRSPTDTDFASKLTTEIIKNGNVLLTGKTIQDIYTQQQIDLSTIPAGGSAVYQWTVTFDPTVNNYYQSNETIFDFDVVFSCGDERTAQLLLTKTNNRLGQDNSPGDAVTYTLTVTAVTDIAEVKVIDLPPKGFIYRGGTWTAYSTVRGNIKAIVTTEPTYHSPGEWVVGMMKAGEVVTLTYIADISTDQDAGNYPDLTLAYGKDAKNNIVYANSDEGYFVGTDVKVVKPIVASAEYSASRSGQVLGLQSELPATGMSVWWTFMGLGLMLIGVIGLKFRAKAGQFIVVALLVFTTTPVYAAGLSIRLSQPKTPTNQKNLNLSFVVLNLDQQPVTVTCLKKGPSESNFSSYGSPITLIPGGTSDRCPNTESIIGEEGLYQFKAVATSPVESVQSQIVGIDFETTTPEPPTDYSKNNAGGCQYTLRFKTANDANTSLVEIFRSDQLAFSADSSTRITSINTNPNEAVEYTDTPPDCQKDYYYAVRAVSVSGTYSSLVGDTIATTTTSTTQTNSATPILIAINTSAVQPPPASEAGKVLGQEDEPAAPSGFDAPVDSTTKTDTGISLWWLGFTPVILLGFWLWFRPRK